ncbi:hypothetical protein RJ639_035135 [Escallonia herrerae]|uniref:F-box domain-containing protein n=1 Tax=Escallonia herrerae TaxID=1293975 RepID=A0AA88WNZ8_9ASTE|nr:hypothetical protein RJ639_035135 [Escallonia herrerae]
MESHRSSTTNAGGLCLLPSELIQYILLRLSLPDVFRFKLVSKSIAFLISDQDFVRDYNLQSSSAIWLFVYKKRWHGPRGEDLYFLTASGDHFLFALNISQEVISVNPVSKTVKRILQVHWVHVARLCGVDLYSSKANKRRSMVARENFDVLRRCNGGERDHSFLSIFNGRNESVLIAAGSQGETPVVVRPRFHGGGNEEGQSAVGFGWGDAINRLQVYGDGNMIKKPHGVMTGCLEEKKGTVRVLLMSNFEGVWDIIWLCYSIGGRQWTWVPLPDCKMKGSNLAGITFSSGLTLS